MVVVEGLEGVDALGDFVDVEWQVGASVDLVSPVAGAAFDGTVALWRSGRENGEWDFGVGGGLLELGHEPAFASIGTALPGSGLGAPSGQKLGRVFGGCAFPRFGDGPFGERIVGGDQLDLWPGKIERDSVSICTTSPGFWKATSVGLRTA
jgi:hypothetical protein